MRFQGLTPMLGVADVQRSIDFYQSALDFKVNGTYAPEGRLCWASLQRDDAHLMLSLCGPGEGAAKSETPPQTSLYICVDDVASLHADLKARGHAPGDLRVTFYKMKEFELRDPDGYLLIVGQDTDEPPRNCA